MSTRRPTVWKLLSSLVILTTLLSIFSPNLLVQAGPGTGFCGDCQTFANAIQPCGVTFGPSDIEINGTYSPPQTGAKCICSDIMQKVLWTCAKCELLAGFGSHSPPPQQYHTTCISWGQSITDWNAPYTGVVAPGTTTPLTGTTNPPPPPNNPGATSAAANPSSSAAGNNGNNGNNGGASSTSSGGTTNPSSSSADNALGGGGQTDSSSGPSGTAIGISVGIIGVALVAGVAAVAMMKRRRRRHAPLELDGTYVGLEDTTWEKPRPSSPPMAPAPIASGASPSAASRMVAGPMGGMSRPSPFESRPGGGGSVVNGGYDHQYDHYDGGYGQPQGYDQYQNHGGYDQGYQYQGHHDYGYDQQIPPPSAPGYHGGKGGDGGQYL